MSGTETEILTGVLDHWRAAVDAHDPLRVATHFTDDAIFQGLHPYSVGPAGIAEYYQSQPIGMTARYEIRETRRPTTWCSGTSASSSPAPTGRP